jgi:putative ABC transport system ATP-binding protein
LCGKFNPKQARERALELLRLVEIESHADKFPAHISGGQQQRVAIARALANDPPILVADEPTGSLDSITADHVFEVFEHLVSDQGKTIIMVTHDQSLASRFTRTLSIADGELEAIGPSSDVFFGEGEHERISL